MEAMPEIDDLLARLFDDDDLNRATLSKPARRELPAKVTVEPVEVRGELAYRFTTQLPDRAVHENLAAPAARAQLASLLGRYRQGLLQGADADWQVLGATVLRRPPTRPGAPASTTGGSATCSRTARRFPTWSSSA